MSGVLDTRWKHKERDGIGNMKHRLQWKFIGIMFVSLSIGVMSMAAMQVFIFTGIYHMTPEEGEVAFAEQSYLFNLFFLVITIFVFFLLSRTLIKRIEDMNHNIEKITNGQMRGLLDDKNHDELANLSNNINKMARQIDESLQNEKNMICNIAHDLRTPITSICGYVELLEKDVDLPELGKQYTAILLRKSNDLSEQVSQLLEYSLLTFQKKEYEKEEMSISSLLEQVLIDFIPIMEKENISYSLKGNQKPCIYRGNQNLLIRLFENLITNSIRYGKEGKRVEIEIQEMKEHFIIDVSNYGKNLTQEESEHIFDYLYQGQSTIHYQTESKGLGLSIAKEIVNIHDGSICVKNDYDLHKVTFEVVL